MSERHSGIGMTSQRTRGRLIERLRVRGIKDEVVLAAMNAVPRHIFIDEALASRAYDDVALPLGFGQTISQPYIVARMIEILRNGQGLNRVLEVGTGCGYQAAVLAQVARDVYSVERLQPLYERAAGYMKELQVRNVYLRYADGSIGLPAVAPFDGIIMAAAATHVPQALLEQLAVGGKMVLPLGAQEQFLCLIERRAQGYHETRLEAVKFVPLLIGKA
ncbi:L-isoaspartate protein carboxylmethyltransferase type II [Candidatus Nitrotoga sp. BS]|uniref:protein-L-isoaspartate(D-aspartate) O-methyltransferase n=1 Tax=Candidatus Nitrotoga sp. BS TaxID=2890408 RepID=UPI001EF1EF6E|nr:protein-L-isoaspartate(D-aspartate) O-methyltransferase [Candidatus Nitrotoga sp. BS]CAH1190461.1 L-isoaspartate protein carboxylmethyltransferase type II [Candidatus Nitrotoga sp. BS]